MTEDQRTPQNIERKIAEAIANRDLATTKGQEEEEARNEAKRKQREEENMDRKADKAHIVKIKKGERAVHGQDRVLRNKQTIAMRKLRTVRGGLTKIVTGSKERSTQ